MPTSSRWAVMFKLPLSRAVLTGLFVGVVLFVLPVLLAHQLWLSYRDQLARAEFMTQNLAGIFDARFEATLRRVDADLVALVEEIPSAALQPGTTKFYTRRINAELDRRMLKAPEMAGYRVHDANGVSRYASDATNVAVIDISDRPFFQLLRDDASAGLVFSDVVARRSNGRPAVVIARALRDEDGLFLGTVQGLIDLDYYRGQFEMLSATNDVVIALRRTGSNNLVLRWPELPDERNEGLPHDHPIAVAMASLPQTATLHYELASELDPRIVSVKKMDDYPFYFAVGIGRTAALAAWRSRAWVLALSTLSLLAICACFGWVLTRMRAREEQISSDLKRSEAQYRELAKLVPVGICHIDHAGLCTYVNDRQLRLTGRRREELIGQPWSDMVHPDDLEAVRSAWQGRDESATVLVCEYRLLGDRGQTIHVLGDIQFEVDADGNFQGAIVAQTDISPHKQAQADLLAAKQEADTANMSKTRFLAAASHDLRQPIQAIGLFRDALARTGLSDEQRNIIDLMSRSVRSLNDLLYALLDVSKLEAGQIKPQMRDVRVEELFEVIESESSALAQQKKLRFKLYYPFKSVRLLTDRGLILSVLRNLVDNAFKYTESGGILVAARARGGRALIQVWDTGIGINAADGELIFDECFQIANPARDRNKGLGLGLSIARRLARLLGGDLTFRSRPGRGTVFQVDLPLAKEDEGAPALLPEVAGGYPPRPVREFFPALRGSHVIVIEDNSLVATALELSLRRYEMSVTIFASGEDLLSSPQAFRADFYISDFRLPGINGVELLEAIQLRSDKPVRAVLMTGDTSPERIRLTAAAPWPVLYKPMELPGLLELMNAALETSTCSEAHR